MIRIEVVSDVVETKSGKIRSGARSGEDYSIRQQEAYLHNGHAYPERFVMALGDQPAYPKGFYQLAPASITVGEYSRLEIARNLVLLKEAPPAVAKAS